MNLGRPLRILWIAAMVFALYLGTASMRIAVGRHITDGSLQWLRGVPGVGVAIDLYCLPASYLARVAALRWALDQLSDFWCEVFAAPETT